MRFKTILLVMVVSATGLIASSARCEEDAPNPVPAAPAGALKDAATLKIEKALDAPTPDANFKDQSLGEIMDAIRQASGLNISVHWTELGNAQGVNKEKPVTVIGKNLSLKSLLNLVFTEAGTDQKSFKYAIKDGVLHISTADKIDEMSITTEFYDVGDLADPNDEQEWVALIKIIEDVVAWDTWKDNGGSIGYIKNFKNVMVVTQTQENLRAIPAILERLRAAGANRPSTAKKQVAQAQARNQIVTSMKETCFDPKAMSLVVIGSMGTELGLSRKDYAAQLETLIESYGPTVSIGIKNAIRLALKDIYLDLGETAKAQQILQKMLDDNCLELGHAEAAAGPDRSKK